MLKPQGWAPWEQGPCAGPAGGPGRGRTGPGWAPRPRKQAGRPARERSEGAGRCDQRRPGSGPGGGWDRTGRASGSSECPAHGRSPGSRRPLAEYAARSRTPPGQAWIARPCGTSQPLRFRLLPAIAGTTPSYPERTRPTPVPRFPCSRSGAGPPPSRPVLPSRGALEFVAR